MSKDEVVGFEFDNHNHLLGVKSGVVDLRSGVVDLRSGEVRSAKPEEYTSQYIDYDPENQKTPNFDSLIRHICQGDAQVRNWLMRFLGYCLTGETREEVLLFLCGKPGTGKTTVLECIKEGVFNSKSAI